MLRKFYSLPWAILFVATTVNATAQDSGTDELPVFARLVKVSLSDFALGHYTVYYEHALNAQSTILLGLSGIAKYDRFQGYSIGSYYDEFGYWYGVDSNLDIAMTGFEITPEIRRYALVNDRMPEGLFASAYGQFRSLSVDTDESFETSDLPETWYDTPYPYEIDHTMKVTTFGLGFSVGYQWMADNGLAMEAFIGPLFRAVSRSYEFTDLPLNQQAAEDGVEDRIMGSFYPGGMLRDTYIGRTGPWIRFGLNIGIGLE